MTIRIVQMLAHGDQINPRTKLLATFTADCGPVRATGCSLLEHDDGSIIALFPRSRADSRVLRFTDNADFKEFQRLALAAYRGLAGQKDPEPAPDAGLRKMLGADVEDALAQAGL